MTRFPVDVWGPGVRGRHLRQRVYPRTVVQLDLERMIDWLIKFFTKPHTTRQFQAFTLLLENTVRPAWNVRQIDFTQRLYARSVVQLDLEHTGVYKVPYNLVFFPTPIFLNLDFLSQYFSPLLHFTFFTRNIIEQKILPDTW